MRAVRRLVLAVVALVVLEGASALALLLLRTAGVEYRTLPALLGSDQRAMIEKMIDASRRWYQQPDPELGWINGARISFAGATQSKQRVRSRRKYAPEPPPGVLRVAAFGDSYVHGDEVRDGEVWSALVEKDCRGVEVMNFGVSGYGVDQAYLRYLRDGRRLHADLVAIGFFPDQLVRNVNVFRPFLAPGTGHQMTKPRFLLEDGALRLLPNPLRDLASYRQLLDDPDRVLGEHAAHDAYFPRGYRAGPLDFLATVRLGKLAVEHLHTPERPPPLVEGRFNPSSEAYAVTLALLEAFIEAARQDGAQPLVVLFPDPGDLHRIRDGKETAYAPLVHDLSAREIPYLDLAASFAAEAPDAKVEELFLKWHYSPRGNAVVARALEAVLDRDSRAQCARRVGGSGT